MIIMIFIIIIFYHKHRQNFLLAKHCFFFFPHTFTLFSLLRSYHCFNYNKLPGFVQAPCNLLVSLTIGQICISVRFFFPVLVKVVESKVQCSCMYVTLFFRRATAYNLQQPNHYTDWGLGARSERILSRPALRTLLQWVKGVQHGR